MSRKVLAKSCSRCHVVLPLEKFYKENRATDGRTAACRDCTLTSQKAYYRANRQGRLVTASLYRESHREELRQKSVKYRDNHSGELSKWHAEYARTQRHGMTRKQRHLIWEMQGFRCPCGCAVTEPNAQVDHDHNCCPGDYSCGSCIRGLVCRSANARNLLAGSVPVTLDR